MLRKPDRFATAFTLGIGMLFSVGLTAGDVEVQLEAAIHSEVVLGDLKGAIDQYKNILAQQGESRTVTAQALLHLGQCFEKLGRREEARSTYSRIVAGYRDEIGPAAEAGRRLADWDEAGPRNLNFDRGVPGKAPPGWFVTAPPKDADQWAELRRSGCRSKSGCAVVRTPDNAPIPVGGLEQTFSASAYRGKTIRLTAWIRVEAADQEDRAQMWLSVDRADGLTDTPVRSAEWTRCEIVTHVPAEATSIRFGFMSFGRGRTWVDDISVQ